MTRPHNTSDEAPELTGSEKDKIMNDFLLPNASVLDFSTKTLDELTMYKFALAVAFKECGGISSQTGRALRAIYLLVEQAEKDAIFEGQQLPWKD